MIRNIYIQNGVLAIISKLRDKLNVVKSLHIQSMGVLILIGVVPLIIFSLIFLNTYRARNISQRVSEIQVRGSVISNLIVSSGYLTSDRKNEVNAELSQVSDMYDGRILIVDSKLKVIRDTYGLEEGEIVVLPEVIKCFRKDAVKVVNQYIDNVEIFVPIMGTDKMTVNGVVVMNFSFQSINALYDNIRTVTFSVILLFAVIIIVVSWILSGKLVKPMKKVVDSIRHIGSGDFSEKMEVQDNLEVANISDAVNFMLTAVQSMEDSRQEFVSNVSHELKTPKIGRAHV